MNYLFVDGNSLGYYHQKSDKLYNGEMEVQAAFGFVKNVRRYASILHARPMILWDGFSENHGSLAAANRGVAEYELSE